jgi:hypothetical protein
MTTAIALLAAWVVLATLIGLMARRFHWRGAILLMVLLVPLVPYVWVQVNPFIALLFLAGVMSILRWPLIFLGRWINRHFTRLMDRFQ